MGLLKIVSVLLMALFFFTPAHATTPTLITATSTCCVYNTLIENRTADGNTFLTFHQQLTLTGGMQGSLVHTFTFIFHSTGKLEVHGRGLFTGSIGGSQPGTAEVSFAATGTISPYTTNGHFVIRNGTGGLSGVHGEGTGGNPDPAHSELGTLSMMVHFDPA